MNFGSKKPTNNDLKLVMIGENGTYEGKYYPFVEEETPQRRLSETGNSFSWTIKNVADKSLEFDITFDNPTEVSQEREKDRLQIEFNTNSEIFVSLESDKPLEMSESGVSFLDLDIPVQFASKE